MYILPLAFMLCASVARAERISKEDRKKLTPNQEIMAYYKDATAGWSKRKNCIFRGWTNSDMKNAIVTFPQFGDYNRGGYRFDLQQHIVDATLLYPRWQEHDKVIAVKEPSDDLKNHVRTGTWNKLKWDKATFEKATIGRKDCSEKEYAVKFEKKEGEEKQEEKCVEVIYIRDLLEDETNAHVYDEETNKFVVAEVGKFNDDDGSYDITRITTHGENSSAGTAEAERRRAAYVTRQVPPARALWPNWSMMAIDAKAVQKKDTDIESLTKALEAKGAALAEKEKELEANRGDDLKAKDEELKAKYDDLKAKDDKLKKEYDDLKAKYDDLKVKDDDLKDDQKKKEKVLKDKDDELKKEVSKLKAKDDVLNAKDVDLKAKDGDLKSKDDELKKTQKKVSELEAKERSNDKKKKSSAGALSLAAISTVALAMLL